MGRSRTRRRCAHFLALQSIERPTMSNGLQLSGQEIDKRFESSETWQEGKTVGGSCENESFLDHAEAVKAYRKPRITLVHIPAKSSDLNLVEKLRGRARKKLHKMPLAECRAGRPVPGRIAYKEKIKRSLIAANAQQKARNLYGNLRTVAKKIVLKKGHGVKG